MAAWPGPCPPARPPPFPDALASSLSRNTPSASPPTPSPGCAVHPGSCPSTSTRRSSAASQGRQAPAHLTRPGRATSLSITVNPVLSHTRLHTLSLQHLHLPLACELRGADASSASDPGASPGAARVPSKWGGLTRCVRNNSWMVSAQRQQRGVDGQRHRVQAEWRSGAGAG